MLDAICACRAFASLLLFYEIVNAHFLVPLCNSIRMRSHGVCERVLRVVDGCKQTRRATQISVLLVLHFYLHSVACDTEESGCLLTS